MIFDYSEKKRYLKNISIKSASSKVKGDSGSIKILNEKCLSLKEFINSIENIYKRLNILNNLVVSTSTYDNFFSSKIKIELISIESVLSQLEIRCMFGRKYDQSNCYIDIQAGSGGIEAQDWAGMLLRMYLRWMEFKNFKINILEEVVGEKSGVKSATVQVSGNYAYGWLRTESGIHRLVRKSPFDSGRRRHTSFASVFIYPEVAKDIDIKISPEDLRYDVYRSSGAGGQHVNRTESAVRITHIPTNTVTQCQSSRSQHKNKSQAMKQLMAKLYTLELKKRQFEKKIQDDEKLDITWGNQIRSYILDRSKIRDLRTGIEIHNVKSVLDGNLDEFIQASIKKFSK